MMIPIERHLDVIADRSARVAALSGASLEDRIGLVFACAETDIPWLVAELRKALTRIAAAEAIAADWLQRACADVEDPASPAVAALTHDIQQALRGDG